MKKWFLILALTLFLAGCSAGLGGATTTTSEAATNVKIVSLSYTNPLQTIESEFGETNTILELSNSFSYIEQINYIYPGDVLTFTVELADPNYEFISLLSITFNDSIIRANVDDSIVSTRDCGEFICIDFPFEVEAGVSQYQIQDVTFAKLNTDVGVSAIIDDTSSNVVSIDVYDEELYPYVVESVQNLNEMIEILNFYQETDDFTAITWNAIFQDWSRVLVIDDFNSALEYAQEINLSDPFDTSFGSASQTLGIIDNGVEKDDGLVEKTHFYFNVYDTIYSEIYFYHIGNTIYVNIMDNDYLLIEMGQRTLIRTLNENDFYVE